MNALRAIVRDQVVDIRCAEGRDADMPGMLAYAAKCRAEVARIYRRRHGMRMPTVTRCSRMRNSSILGSES